MKFFELPLKGAFLITPEAHHDDRGFFARTFCHKEFAALSLITTFVQCSTSFNYKEGLIRGMHYQENPYEETKLVRCIRGGIFDVIIDLRKASPTYKEWYGTELTSINGNSLYIPKGFAHGYQVLKEDTEVFYMMDEYYMPSAAKEVTPDSFSIIWPLSIIK